jgi:hypothetical protein
MMSIPTRHNDNCIDFIKARNLKVYNEIKRHVYDVTEYFRLESYSHYELLAELDGNFEPDFDPESVSYPIIIEYTYDTSSVFNVFLLAEDYYKHCKSMCELYEGR